MKTTKITKKELTEFVKMKLKTDDKWALRALVSIYNLQTEDEKQEGYTSNLNFVGFSGAHSAIMSSMAVQYLMRGRLSEKQMNVVKKIISKYHRQIIDISNKEKLENIYLKYKNPEH